MATKASKISLLFILLCYSFIINAVPGTFEPVIGSPFPTNIAPTSVAYSPDVSGNLFAAIINSAVIGSPSNNLSIYSVNTTNGQFTLAESVPTVVPSQSVAFSPEVAGNLFVAFTRGGSGYNTVTTYSVNTINGQLTLVGSYPTGNSPVSVAFSPEVARNLFAAVANNSSSTVSVYSVNTTTGQFTPVAGSPFVTGNSPSSVTFSPDVSGNLFAAVTNAGNSTVSVYSVNTTTGQFTPAALSPLAISNPSSVAFSPDVSGNLFAAVTNNISSIVSVYSVNTNTGQFSLVAGSPYATGTTPQSVAFSPDVSGNLFAATSNYGSNTVSVYSVNTNTGQFTPVTGSPYATGTNPYSVAFSPYVSNLFAAVTNNSDGTISAYQVLLQPIVTSINPVRGPASGGTSVTIDGMNFTNPSTVSFGGLPATAVTFVSSSELIAISPAGTGTVDIIVITDGGTSTTSVADQFTYIALPTVTSITPTQGSTSGGTSVILTGTNLSTTTAVSFGGTPATSFVINSDTQITATSPARAAGSVNITVTAVGGTSTAAAGNLFTYIAPPTVVSIAPMQGPTTGGTSVVLTGTNFTGATAISFGGTAATNFVVNSNTQITAVSPAEAAGSVNITITTVGGTSTATAGNLFTYIAPPTVTSIAPTQGPIAGGTSVILTGTNLSGATAVSFGGTPATSFVVNSNTQITAISPARAAGSVNITVTTVGGNSVAAAGNLFTYIAPPTVTIVNPDEGAEDGGTVVTLTGTNLSTTSGVLFGSTPATSFTVISDTQITTISPAGMAGNINIIVTAVGGTSTAAPGNLFSYIPLPSVTDVSPSQGPSNGGTLVTLTGINFNTVTAVQFGSLPATSFTIISDTEITAVSPAGAAGNINIIVTNVDGASSASSNNIFTYIGLPTLTAVTPSQGPLSGGTTVTLTGTSLSTTSGVFFGSIPALSFTVISDTEITAVSPAGVGVVNVNVTNIEGTSASSPAHVFAYVSSPLITTITPNQGLTSGGTPVTIIGNNFTSTSAVFFGNIPVLSFTVISDSQINAISPAALAGVYNITVVTDFGVSSPTAASQFTYALPLLPPKNAKIHQVSRRFATQTDLINVITWQPPSSGVAPVSYEIFRDPELTQLVAVVNADRAHLRFNDHNRKKYQRYDYYLVSIDAKNQQSAAIRLKIGKIK